MLAPVFEYEKENEAQQNSCRSKTSNPNFKNVAWFAHAAPPPPRPVIPQFKFCSSVGKKFAHQL